ncbi:MAG: hypothetical protein Q7R35_20190, partial [Elusimicrobiota bacterium]|nr:hypothetical protein [Elusimicrobiota bacterium]
MNTKKIFNFLAPALACALLFHSPAAAQTAPSLISFQGRLTDNLNNPLAGSYSFDFAIYAALTGGPALWTESQAGITVANGVLMAELGSSSPIPDSVFSSAQRYLEITVNGTTLAPRQRLLSVPYAINALTLDGKGYSALVSTDAAQVISGAKTFTADISMSGTARVTDLAAPAAAGDAANKAYVDSAAGASQGSVLSSTQTFTGRNTFYNLVTLSSGLYITAGRINLNGNLVTTAAGLLDAAKLANTVPNSSLDSSSVTKRGNSFNGPGQLVLLNAFNRLPAVDGSQLINVAAGSVEAAAVLPGTFSPEVILPAAQVRAGNLGPEVIVSSLAEGSVFPDNLQSGIYNIDILGNAGTVSNGVYTTNSYYNPPWLTGLATGKINLSTVTAQLALKANSSAVLTNSATVPAGLINLSTVTLALEGKLSNTATVSPSLIDLSTVAAALDGKLTDSASVPQALVDLSTVAAALELKADSASVLPNYATVPPALINLSTVTAELVLKADSSAVLANIATVPAGLINLSTVTAALAGKLANTATVPGALINLSTVTTALAAKLDITGNGSSLTGLTPAQVGLGNVTNVEQLPASYLDTDALLAANSDIKVPSQKAAREYMDVGLSTKADTSALTSGLAGKLSNTDTVPPGLIDLSTVSMQLAYKLSNTANVPAWLVDLSTVATALAGKLATSGNASALTNITAANISAGKLGPAVIASSLAVNSVYTRSIQDGALTFTKLAVNNCGAGEVLRRNANNTAWMCGPDEGGVSGTFNLAPTSPLLDTSANPSVYVNDTGGGDFIHFLENGVDGFIVDNTGLITTGSIGAAQIVPGPLSSGVIASSLAVNAVYPGSVRAGSYGVDILGNAATVSNGIYTTNSYSDPAWLASLSTSKVDLSTVTTALANEAGYRGSADNAIGAATGTLRVDLTGETNNRMAADNAIRIDTTTIAGNLATAIINNGAEVTNEANARIGADDAIGATTGTLRVDLTGETNNRIAADNAIRIDTTTIASGLATEITDRGTAVTNEANARAAGDDAIRIDTTTIADNLATAIINNGAEVTNEANARIGADNAIGATTGTLRVDLTGETNNRLAADDAIRIDTTTIAVGLAAEITDRGAAVTNEANTRIGADTALGVETGTLRVDLTGETSNRLAADNAIRIDTTTIAVGLAAEITDRGAAVTNEANTRI